MNSMFPSNLARQNLSISISKSVVNACDINQNVTLRVTPTPPYDMHGNEAAWAALLAWRGNKHRRGGAGSCAPLPRACAYQHGLRGWPCGCPGHRKCAGRSWRNSQGQRAADLGKSPTRGWKQSAILRGTRRKPACPPQRRLRCRCSALREIASAWPLPYVRNKLNWVFQFSFYEDNQDKGNN